MSQECARAISPGGPAPGALPNAASSIRGPPSPGTAVDACLQPAGCPGLLHPGPLLQGIPSRMHVESV